MKSTTHLKKEISIPAVGSKGGGGFLPGNVCFATHCLSNIYSGHKVSNTFPRISFFSRRRRRSERRLGRAKKESSAEPEMQACGPQGVGPDSRLPSLHRAGGSLLTHQALMRTPAETSLWLPRA